MTDELKENSIESIVAERLDSIFGEDADDDFLLSESKSPLEDLRQAVEALKSGPTPEKAARLLAETGKLDESHGRDPLFRPLIKIFGILAKYLRRVGRKAHQDSMERVQSVFSCMETLENSDAPVDQKRSMVQREIETFKSFRDDLKSRKPVKEQKPDAYEAPVEVEVEAAPEHDFLEPEPTEKPSTGPEEPDVARIEEVLAEEPAAAEGEDDSLQDVTLLALEEDSPTEAAGPELRDLDNAGALDDFMKWVRQELGLLRGELGEIKENLAAAPGHEAVLREIESLKTGAQASPNEESRDELTHIRTALAGLSTLPDALQVLQGQLHDPLKGIRDSVEALRQSAPAHPASLDMEALEALLKKELAGIAADLNSGLKALREDLQALGSRLQGVEAPEKSAGADVPPEPAPEPPPILERPSDGDSPDAESSFGQWDWDENGDWDANATIAETILAEPLPPDIDDLHLKEEPSPDMDELQLDEEEPQPDTDELQLDEEEPPPDTDELFPEEGDLSPDAGELQLDEEEDLSPDMDELQPDEEEPQPDTDELFPEEEDLSPDAGELQLDEEAQPLPPGTGEPQLEEEALPAPSSMEYFLFQAGSRKYAIDARYVVKAVKLKKSLAKKARAKKSLTLVDTKTAFAGLRKDIEPAWSSISDTEIKKGAFHLIPDDALEGLSSEGAEGAVFLGTEENRLLLLTQAPPVRVTLGDEDEVQMSPPGASPSAARGSILRSGLSEEFYLIIAPEALA